MIQDLDTFKRITRLNLFFQGSNEDSKVRDTQSGVPFEHKSLKPKSTFNPVGPFQLETMFYSIEQDLHRLKYRQPRKKKPIQSRIPIYQVTEKQSRHYY